MPGLVTSWMADCLQAGIPYWCEASQPASSIQLFILRGLVK